MATEKAVETTAEQTTQTIQTVLPGGFMEKELGALEQFINTAIEFLTNYSFQVVGAIIVLIIGFIAANWVQGMMLKLFEKKKMDITLSRFLAGVIKMLVLVFAILIALGKFGITIAPFIAAIGALAFGASMALSGPLSNYGAGISIIIGRPFVVGDTITVAGQSGVVQEVKLAATILTDEDGVRITIPNKHIVGEVSRNSKANKIVENMVGVSYGCDPEKAVQVIAKTINGFSEVVKEPKPQIGIQQFGESSIDIGCRYWIPTIKYYQILFTINSAIFKALKDAGITIPFPQRDIHIISQPQ